MTDFKIVIKRNENDYVVLVDETDVNSGYNVVPKTVDEYNAYDIEEVKAYCLANPTKVLTEHPLKAKLDQKNNLENQLKAKENELQKTNKQAFDIMSQDYVSKLTGVSTFALSQADILAVFEKKATLETDIETLKDQLKML